MTGCEEVVTHLLSGLQSQLHVQVEDQRVCSVTLPLETQGGEAIHVYVEKQGQRFFLSDEGETLANLFSYNIKREGEVKDLLATYVRRFGLHEEEGALVRHASASELRTAVLEYATAVQKISGLELKRRAEKSQHFDLKVRNALTLRGVPYDRAWRPEVSEVALTIDFASTNHEALFLALGTVSTSPGQMLSMLKAKLFNFAELEIAGQAERFERVVILDEATDWPAEVLTLATKHSDHTLDWPANSDDVEGILMANAALR